MQSTLSETGRLTRVLVKHPRDAFVDAATIAREWQSLNFTGAPSLAAANDEYEAFLDILRRNGAQVDFLPRDARANLDSIYARLTQEIYRSVRPECEKTADVCAHCHDIAEEQALLFLRGLPNLRCRLSDDVQAYISTAAARTATNVATMVDRVVSGLILRSITHLLLTNKDGSIRIMQQ